MHSNFSGFGGDQAISHNAANVATDLVDQRRWKILFNGVGDEERSESSISSPCGNNNQSIANAKIKQRVMKARRTDLLVRHLTKKVLVY